MDSLTKALSNLEGNGGLKGVINMAAPNLPTDRCADDRDDILHEDYFVLDPPISMSGTENQMMIKEGVTKQENRKLLGIPEPEVVAVEVGVPSNSSPNYYYQVGGSSSSSSSSSKPGPGPGPPTGNLFLRRDFFRKESRGDFCGQLHMDKDLDSVNLERLSCWDRHLREATGYLPSTRGQPFPALGKMSMKNRVELDRVWREDYSENEWNSEEYGSGESDEDEDSGSEEDDLGDLLVPFTNTESKTKSSKATVPSGGAGPLLPTAASSSTSTMVPATGSQLHYSILTGSMLDTEKPLKPIRLVPDIPLKTGESILRTLIEEVGGEVPPEVVVNPKKQSLKRPRSSSSSKKKSKAAPPCKKLKLSALTLDTKYVTDDDDDLSHPYLWSRRSGRWTPSDDCLLHKTVWEGLLKLKNMSSKDVVVRDVKLYAKAFKTSEYSKLDWNEISEIVTRGADGNAEAILEYGRAMKKAKKQLALPSAPGPSSSFSKPKNLLESALVAASQDQAPTDASDQTHSRSLSPPTISFLRSLKLFSPRDCLHRFHQVLRGANDNVNKWSRNEDYKLRELAGKFGRRNWPGITRELGTGRSVWEVFVRHQRMVGTGELDTVNGEGDSKRVRSGVASQSSTKEKVATSSAKASKNPASTKRQPKSKKKERLLVDDLDGEFDELFGPGHNFDKDSGNNSDSSNVPIPDQALVEAFCERQSQALRMDVAHLQLSLLPHRTMAGVKMMVDHEAYAPAWRDEVEGERLKVLEEIYGVAKGQLQEAGEEIDTEEGGVKETAASSSSSSKAPQPSTSLLPPNHQRAFDLLSQHFPCYPGRVLRRYAARRHRLQYKEENCPRADKRRGGYTCHNWTANEVEKFTQILKELGPGNWAGISRELEKRHKIIRDRRDVQAKFYTLNPHGLADIYDLMLMKEHVGGLKKKKDDSLYAVHEKSSSSFYAHRSSTTKGNSNLCPIRQPHEVNKRTGSAVTSLAEKLPTSLQACDLPAEPWALKVEEILAAPTRDIALEIAKDLLSPDDREEIEGRNGVRLSTYGYSTMVGRLKLTGNAKADAVFQRLVRRKLKL